MVKQHILPELTKQRPLRNKINVMSGEKHQMQMICFLSILTILDFNYDISCCGSL